LYVQKAEQKKVGAGVTAFENARGLDKFTSTFVPQHPRDQQKAHGGFTGQWRRGELVQINPPEINICRSSSFWKNTLADRDKASRYKPRTKRVSQLSLINTAPNPAILLITGMPKAWATIEP
jgi:hypothetical protein